MLTHLLTLAQLQAFRDASVHEVQPSESDAVHAVWLNGPTHSAKLPSSASSSWPAFEAGAIRRPGTRCAVLDDTRYTGYDDGGQYCQAASTALDDDAHLLLHSGRLGIVVDAGGLTSPASSSTRNLIPKIGALGSSSMSAREAYDALAPASTNATLEVTCGAGATTTDVYVLGAIGDAFVQVGLVRQGHAVTQLTLTGLEFQNAATGSVHGPCESFVAAQQSNADFAAAAGGSGRRLTSPTAPERPLSHQNESASLAAIQRTVGGVHGSVHGSGRQLTHTTGHHCNQDYGGASHPCPSADFPRCVGFVPGSGWGKCWSVCTASGAHPNLWVEVSVWGDSISAELAWDADFSLGAAECAGAVQLSLGAFTRRVELAAAAERRVGLLLTTAADGASLVAAPASSHPAVVSSSAGRWVRSRAATRDVVVEVPTSVGTCGYNVDCAAEPLKLVDVVLTNPHPAEDQTLRLTFSRNFPTRDASVAQSRPGAEITGLSVQLWQTASMQPTGIPLQISKNWHVGSTAAYWAGRWP